MRLALSDLLILLSLQQNMAPGFRRRIFSSRRPERTRSPSTVLTAMAYGVPVVGFAGTGNEEQLLGAWAASSFPTVASAVKVLPGLPCSGGAEDDGPMRAGKDRALKGYQTNAGNVIDVLS